MVVSGPSLLIESTGSRIFVIFNFVVFRDHKNISTTINFGFAVLH